MQMRWWARQQHHDKDRRAHTITLALQQLIDGVDTHATLTLCSDGLELCDEVLRCLVAPQQVAKRKDCPLTHVCQETERR